MSSDLSIRIRMKGSTKELLNMIKILKVFDNEMYGMYYDRRDFSDLRDSGIDAVYISSLRLCLNKDGNCDSSRGIDYLTNGELVELFHTLGNEIELSAMGPYGRIFEPKEACLFETLADVAPGAFFEGVIDGFTTGASVEHRGKLIEGKLYLSDFILIDEERDCDFEYDSSYIEQSSLKRIYDPETQVTTKLYTDSCASRAIIRPDFDIANGVLKYYYGNCENDGELVIPNGVKEIGVWSFSDRRYIKSVTIPDSVRKISYGAFKGCINLKSITVPKSVTEIEPNAFLGCAGLQDEQGFLIINGILVKYFGEEENVVIPYGVTRIGGKAFAYNHLVKTVIIPEGVTEIGYKAFSYCGVESLFVSDSVTNIDPTAFEWCYNCRIHAHADSFVMKYVKRKRLRYKTIK